MDSEARRRCEARAVGRTPEEHAALEQALARRRARRREAERQRDLDRVQTGPIQRDAYGGDASGLMKRISRYSQEVELVQRAMRLEAFGYEEENYEDGASSGPDDSEDGNEDAQADPPATYQEYKREKQSSNRGLHWNDGLEYAMFRMRAQAASPAPMPPTLKDPPRRRGHTRLSDRKARGEGWHRGGYRDLGDMWINVKGGTYGSVKGQDVNENATVKHFVWSIFNYWESVYPPGWYCDLFFRKKSLIRMLVDPENDGVQEHERLVRDYFDGGETVYFTAFDSAGRERDIRC
ncbi:Uu.00g056590.m01.CDS01 [Anthostomella pinea]|uniref:Uu.00g056590.m01.CDS01 n=1 Tax=Anthostomella pinea TaxID=933095 RepID=A0AAI8VS61_9PEZI|nr:Uu.00g056590.m01.CDS01 [Anthostomella pinea]